MHFPWYIQSHHSYKSTPEQLSSLLHHNPAWQWSTVRCTQQKNGRSYKTQHSIGVKCKHNVHNHVKKPCIQACRPSLPPSSLRPAKGKSIEAS